MKHKNILTALILFILISGVSIADDTSSSSEACSLATSTSSQESSSSSYISSTSSSSYASSTQASTTSSSAYSSTSRESSSTSSQESSSSSSSIFATTTLTDCNDNYILACMNLDGNETGCEASYTVYEGGYFYNCIYTDGLCNPDERGNECTAGTNPSCQDMEVYDCNAVESEEDCGNSYQYGEVYNTNCYWMFSYCYAGYAECDIVIDECQDTFSFGCPLINNSNDCNNAYSEFEGSYNCIWSDDFGCWFGDVCEKIIYEQCNANIVEDCYLLNETACEGTYVIGEGDYGWNCRYLSGEWEGCYYAESCHEGFPLDENSAVWQSIVNMMPYIALILIGILAAVLVIIPFLLILRIFGFMGDFFDNILKMFDKLM